MTVAGAGAFRKDQDIVAARQSLLAVRQQRLRFTVDQIVRGADHPTHKGVLLQIGFNQTIHLWQYRSDHHVVDQ